jgi:uncharacterized protein (DUF2236 family)
MAAAEQGHPEPTGVPSGEVTLGADSVIGMGLLAGGANVIMQLSWPGVGYGVVESRVESGSLFKHPVKRTRTTLTYLAVAFLGTPEERAAYRREVNRQHAQVHSSGSSPVSYNAFDPELQLWVAACLYRGVEDVGDVLGPELSEEEKDLRYAESAVLGTTLQVPADMWPADRAAFERYWQESLSKVHIDDTVRAHLYDVAMLRFLPRPVSTLLGPLNRFITTGFLPPRFREEMRLPWDARRQRRFDRLMRLLRGIVEPMPGVLRRFPYNLCMWDLRVRMRLRRPLV